MKRCPRCGRSFPESYLYCDQDATRLPERRRRFHFVAPAAITAALLGAVVIAGPAFAKRYAATRFSIQVTDLSLASVPLVWPPLGSGAELDMKLNVQNRSALSPVLESVQSDCSTFGQNRFHIEWSNSELKPLTIPAGQDTTITLRVTLRNLDSRSILDLPVHADANCRGPVAFRLWGLRMSQDIQFQRRIW